MTEPTLHVRYKEQGIEIRFFSEDKDAEPKVKRHYELRDVSDPVPNAAWHEVPGVTDVLNILKKEQLIAWAQRVGASGVVQLFNMGVLAPVSYEGKTVLGTHIPGKGAIVIGEEQALDLLGQYRLTTNSLKKAGGKRGQSCHDALETWASIGELPNPAFYPVTEQGYVQGLLNFLQESEAEPVRSEVVVGSARYGYAGRYDVDIELPQSVQLMTHHTPAGRGDKLEWFEAGLYRVDLKTAKDVFEEHGEQLEAYEQAAVECGLPESIKRVVLNTSPESRYKFKPSWSTFADFEATLHKFRLNEERKQRKKEMS